jgi:hypothetical protein
MSIETGANQRWRSGAAPVITTGCKTPASRLTGIALWANAIGGIDINPKKPARAAQVAVRAGFVDDDVDGEGAAMRSTDPRLTWFTF